jgi:enediyne biosynthesis protein E4
MTYLRNARVRGFVPGVVALAAITAMFFIARLPVASGATKSAIADSYKLTEMALAMPSGYRPVKTLRPVNPDYYKIRSWISSVGAGIALNDLAGRGRADTLCITDTRTDQVVVTYAPTTPAADRFTPFVLNPAPLPMDARMAPMGCNFGDFNRDARMDMLVYYWGRTPVLFLAKADATRIEPASYRPVELVPNESPDGRYHGPRWNTNAVSVADFTGTGRPDLFIGNYFPDSDVLHPQGPDNVTMNSSMSTAKNAGGGHILRWYGGKSGNKPSASYVPEQAAIPYSAATGWTLAAASADLTGEGRPELYIANDFGPDHLLYNTSTAGQIKFTEATGRRGLTDPKSFVLGHDSFKGMGVDFGDLDSDGQFDMFVSNITSAWGLEESNLVFINQAKNTAEMQRKLAAGEAPFDQQAQERGMAWTGWGWGVKMDDFRNSGTLDVVQAAGFIKGKIDRWPWLQEMAMSNDNIYTDPHMWPHVQPGDDVAGSQPVAFYAKSPKGTYTNISKQLGLAKVTTPTRGIATGDSRGNGALDLAVARQWGPPAFYANNSAGLGNHLTLQLYQPADGGGSSALQAPGTPAYGATARITTADGRTQINQLDGGGGHSGRRSFDVRFGLGDYSGPVTVQLKWCDASGRGHEQTLRLAPGHHTLILTDSTAKEVPSR